MIVICSQWRRSTLVVLRAAAPMNAPSQKASHPAKRIDNAANGKKHWWQVCNFSLNGHTGYQEKPFM